jgi:antirestriction protein ArdC
MDWYIVIKTIKSRRYYYRQKTWRENGRVRTLSQYIGPVDGVAPAMTPSPAEPDVPVSTQTLSAPKFDQAHFDKAFQLVMGEQSKDWEHHWTAGRRGKSLVSKVKRIEATLAALGISWTHDTSGAYFRPTTGEVNIPPNRCFVDKNGQTATQAYYVVVFHEVVHWTKTHLSRPAGSSMFDRMEYAREELVAELGAVALMQHFGLELGAPARHAKYFQVWLSRAGDDKAALVHAKKHAAGAVRYILEHGKMQHDQNS